MASKPARDVVPAADTAGVPDRLLRRVAPRFAGARICYGKPVRSGDVTVIPVASVRGGVGFGFGQGTDPAKEQSGSGGGGGSGIAAKPVGYVEVTPHGTRFKRIHDVEGTLQAVTRAAIGIAFAATLLRRGRDGGAWRPRAYAALLTRRK